MNKGSTKHTLQTHIGKTLEDVRTHHGHIGGHPGFEAPVTDLTETPQTHKTGVGVDVILYLCLVYYVGSISVLSLPCRSLAFEALPPVYRFSL